MNPVNTIDSNHLVTLIDEERWHLVNQQMGPQAVHLTGMKVDELMSVLKHLMLSTGDHSSGAFKVVLNSNAMTILSEKEINQLAMVPLDKFKKISYDEKAVSQDEIERFIDEVVKWRWIHCGEFFQTNLAKQVSMVGLSKLKGQAETEGRVFLAHQIQSIINSRTAR